MRNAAPTTRKTARMSALAARQVGRRRVLAGAAGAAATGLATHLGAPAHAKVEIEKATFVLVPGQWTGAFVWHTVTPILREAGHDVYPVTCTGLGDRVHLANPAIDLDTHITDVVNTIEYADLSTIEPARQTRWLHVVPRASQPREIGHVPFRVGDACFGRHRVR